MGRRARLRAAWLSYLGIQCVWALLVLLTPVLAAGPWGPPLGPGALGLPFCCVTAANGLHLTCFRGEYGALLARAAAVLPFGERLVPCGSLPCGLPLGAAYTLAGVAGALGIVLA